MLNSFRKSFSSCALRRFASRVSPLGLKMLRYFPNAAEDAPDCAVELDREAAEGQLQAHLHHILKRLQPVHRNVDGGLYVGVSGVAYMFYYLSRSARAAPEQRGAYLKKALDYIKPALEKKSGGSDRTSFLLGDAGTTALAAVIFKELGEERYVEYLDAFKSLYSSYLEPKFLKCGGDEFFVGRAGYLAGVLWLNRELETQVLPYEDLHKICDVIVECGREYSKKHRSPSPLMYAYYKTEYLGAAHGISFILQMLITVPGYLEYNKSASKDIRTSVDFILSLQTAEGNWPCCMEEVGMTDHKLVHWCHGAPGIVYLMAKAFQVYEDQQFYDSCIKAGEVVWQKGLLRKGPGICHGVAGSGYVFLLLYRLTGDQKYLYRAQVFANFMDTTEFRHGANVPDNPYSLYEGTAGTVCFLADLMNPDKAEFPFQDVFTEYK